METLITQIQQIQQKLTSGTITSDELENLVDLSRELYEKSVILRFKSFEEKVFPSREFSPLNETFAAKNEAEVEINISEKLADIEEPEASTNFESTVRSAMHETIQPVFDFQLFDDLEAKKEDIPSESASLTDNSNDVESVQEEEIDAENTEEISATILTIEPVLEPKEINLEEKEEAKIEESASPVAETEAHTEIKSATKTSTLFNQIPSILVAGENNWMSGKIVNLQSSFGFNDRLQCISELFNGSSEKYSETLQQLDELTQFDAAKSILEPIARENGWDLESDLTIEFIQKVERRYL